MARLSATTPEERRLYGYLLLHDAGFLMPIRTTPASFLRTTCAAVLCGLLIQPALYGLTPPKPAAHASAIAADERAQHLLNRFTFGPRPGDVSALRGEGADRWFEQQLHPASIDDSALEAQLAHYPAMQLSTDQLMERYPSNNALKAIAAGRQPLPSDPQTRALVQDQVAFYQLRTAGKAGAKTAPNAAMALLGADASMADGSPPPPTPQQLQQDQKVEAAAAQEAARALPQHDAALFSQDRTNQILSLPPEQRINAVLALKPDDVIAFRRSLSRRELAHLAANLSPSQREILTALQGSTRLVGAETLDTRLLRDLNSSRQVEAVMTDFWLNHFNIYIRKSQVEPYLLSSFERDTIRPHALGKFEDLLVATAQSPAMMVYLDNAQSAGANSQMVQRRGRVAQFGGPLAKLAQKGASGLNENYARELMELHTLGVNGGYTQADVTQVAKVFTGWTLDRPLLGSAFTFDPKRHEPGSKTVLGHTIAESGQREGLEVLHLLATSPATAHFLSEKLAVRFVSDTPPSALVDRMAQTYLSTSGDISQVLRTLCHSPEFWSPEVYRAKVKTPLEFVTSAVRASGAATVNPTPLVQALAKLGMPLYGMQTPNGYSWTANSWVSTGALVNRMNFALILADNRVQGTQINWSGTVPAGSTRLVSTEDAAQSTALESSLERSLLGGPAAQHTRDAVLGQLSRTDLQDQAEQQFRAAPVAGADATMTPPDMTDGSDMASTMMKPGKGGGKKAGGNGGEMAALRPTPITDPEQRRAALIAGLLLGSPDFQRR